MKIGFRIAMALGFGLAVVQLRAASQDAPASSNSATNAPKLSPQEQKERWSYSYGMRIGQGIKSGGVELDVEALSQAIKDVVAGREPKLTEQQAKEAFTSLQMEARSKAEEVRRQGAEKNKKAGEAFLAENKTKPGVKTHTVDLPGGATADMQYKVITEGTGPIPTSNDVVTVTYKGTLINGTEFDNSAKHGGKPAKFQVNRVVRGWTTALQMMKVGSKWELYLPSSLAYGDNGHPPTIEPGAVLIFEMELNSIESAQTPSARVSPSAPLTSDIIKVPSAEELKKGAKIEVIKAEDLEKMTNAAATNAPGATPEKK
jgi:FKBP-type peptidyl-prolyl cis-trans isomerase FklB